MLIRKKSYTHLHYWKAKKSHRDTWMDIKTTHFSFVILIKFLVTIPISKWVVTMGRTWFQHIKKRFITFSALLDKSFHFWDELTSVFEIKAEFLASWWLV